MNARTLIAIASFAVAGSAFAQEATSDAWMNAASTKNRTEVLADLQQARADGSIKALGAGYLNPVIGQRSREAVRAEVLAAARNGELDRLNAEAFAFDAAPAAKTTRLAHNRR